MPEYLDPTLHTFYDGETETFGANLNLNFARLRDALIGSHADAALLFTTVFGQGRIAGSNSALGAPIAGHDLTIQLPNGSQWVVNGTFYTVNEPAGYLSLDVPPGKANGVYGYLSFDPEIGELTVAEENWFDALQPSGVAGRPCIGKIVTDATGVVSIDLSVADVIPTYMGLLSRMASLEGRMTFLETHGGAESGNGESGGAGALYAEDLAWSREENGTNAKDKVLTLFQQAKDYTDGATGGNNFLAARLPSDIMASEQAKLAVGLAEINPSALVRMEMAMVYPGIYGTGEMGGPNYLGNGTMFVNKEERILEP